MESMLPLLTGSAKIQVVERCELPKVAESRADSDAIVLLNGSSRDAFMLKELGFPHVRAYQVCPSVAQARWIFPSGPAGRRALDEYVAQRIGGKLLKLFTRVSLWCGRNTLLVATRMLPSLEQELAARLHQPVQLAYSLGTPGAYSKTTVTVLSHENQVIAFAKAANSPDACAATLHEGEILASLARYTTLRSQIPEVKASFRLDGVQVLVTSAGPNTPSAKIFGEGHRRFLRVLAECTGQPLRFETSRMWQNMQEGFARVEAGLTPRWQTRLQAALQLIGRELAVAVVPMGLAHRDFVPWNIRTLPDGSLYVFDWEFAQMQYTPLYDLYHFELMLSHHLRRRRLDTANALRLLREAECETPRARIFFLAYLADVSLFYFDALRLGGGPESGILQDCAQLLDDRERWLAGARRA
jgi:thiamine kinase-like enzyme